MQEIPRKYFPLIIALLIIPSLFGLNSPKIYFGDEAYYLNSGIHMVGKNEWLTPVHEGEIRFQKPIFFYWLVAGSYKLFGISFFSGRLPSVLAMAVLAFFLWRLAKLLFESDDAGFYSALVFLSTPMTIWYGRTAMTDMSLSFFMTAAFYYGLRGFIENGHRRRNFAISFIFMGLGMITKGIAGFFFPMTAILLYGLFSQERRKLIWHFIHPLNLLIFLAISLPWPITMYVIHGESFVSHIFKVELTGRFSLSFLKIIKALGYYLGVLLRYGFPWILLLPFEFVLAGGILRDIRRTNRNALTALSIFSGLLFLCYSIFIADIRARYLLPVMPMIAVIVGAIIYKAEEWWAKVVLGRVILGVIGFIAIVQTIFCALGRYLSTKVDWLPAVPFIMTLAIIITGCFGALVFHLRHEFKSMIITICIFLSLTINLLLAWTIPSLSPSPVGELAKQIKKYSTEPDLYGFSLSDGESTTLRIIMKRELPNFHWDISKIEAAMDEASQNTYIIVTEEEYKNHLRHGYVVLSEAFGFKRLNAGKLWESIQNGEVAKYLEIQKEYYVLIQGTN